MVIIVPAFSNSAYGHSPILDRVDVGIVRFVTPHMGRWVYKPGHVQWNAVPWSSQQEKERDLAMNTDNEFLWSHVDDESCC